MTPISDHDEARRELTAILDGNIGSVPLTMMVDHLMASYADEGWEFLRDAALALRRRVASAKAEQLKVAERPKGRVVLGSYRTRRHGDAPRPYHTQLHALDPLQLACDCPDYLKGGLGICKHGLTVLHDLGARPRVLARGRTEPPSVPLASWHAILPVHGPNDRLAAIRVPDPSTVSRALRTRLTSLIMVCPIETWPSPAITVLPFLRTAKMVVPRHPGKD